MTKFTLLAVLPISLGFAHPSLAQDRVVPPKTPEALVPQFELTPHQQYLMKEYSISPDEAKRRTDLQSDIAELAAKLSTGDRDNFGGLYIQHRPVFQIVVGFKEPSARQNFRDEISPKLRSVVKIRSVRRSIAEVEQLTDEVATKLRAASLRFHSFYSFETDSIIVQLDDDEKVSAARSVLGPKLASDVQIRKGETGKTFEAVDVQPGDAVYGGWHWDPGGDASKFGCSFSFAARSKAGNPLILSAGHCGTIPYIWQGTHYVVLSSPLLSNNTGKYDYKGWTIDGLTTGAWVFYENNKVRIPGYENVDNVVLASGAASGYFKVIGTYGYYSQVAGDVLCKNGYATGFTCGTIVDGAATWNGVRGWIKTARSNQTILAWSGDSGGAVFTDFTYDGKVKAAGILSGGAYVSDVDSSGRTIERPCLKSDVSSGRVTQCWMIHMPIDRLNDDPNFGSIMIAP